MSNEVKFRSVVCWTHHKAANRSVAATSYRITAYIGEWGQKECVVLVEAQTGTPDAAGELLRDWKEFFQHFAEIEHRDV